MGETRGERQDRLRELHALETMAAAQALEVIHAYVSRDRRLVAISDDEEAKRRAKERLEAMERASRRHEQRLGIPEGAKR